MPKRTSENGHAVSGATRDAARALIMAAVDSGGYKKLEISPAPITAGDGTACVQHYAVGDLHCAVQHRKPSAGEVIVCIDTDYYLRDLDEVFGYPNPAVMHSFSPLRVAGLDGDAPYRIKNNEIHYDVGGGTRWSHRVWDGCGFGSLMVICNFRQVRSGSWNEVSVVKGSGKTRDRKQKP